MRRKPGTNKQIVYERGTKLDDIRVDVKVYYEPVETENLIIGVSDLDFLGDSNYFEPGAAAKPETSPVAPTRKPTVHVGGEVQTSMLLSGPNAFTVMSVIKEIHIYKADSAA